jgi:hypothetical protein
MFMAVQYTQNVFLRRIFSQESRFLVKKLVKELVKEHDYEVDEKR